MGACFRLFDQVYLALDANPTSHFLAQFFLETRLLSEFLEPMMGFLHIWSQNYGSKTKTLVRI